MVRTTRIAGLFLAITALTVTASLRVRHCYPLNHDPGANPHADDEKLDTTWWNKIHPGAWDGYDEQEGFDLVADTNLGSFDNAPYVTASYWLDSMFAKYGDAAFVDDAATESAILDPDYTLARDGYFVLVYGQITFPVDGEYELYLCGDDGGMILWIDLDRNGIDEHDTIGVGKEDYSGESLYLIGDQRLWKDARYSKKTIEAGSYRVRGWKWDWGQVSHAGFFWKKPGDQSPQPVPASAFGLRRNIGPPRVTVTRVLKNDQQLEEEKWGNLDVVPEDTLTFHVSAINMGDYEPTFIWDFGDGSEPLETSDSVVSHAFQPDPDIFVMSPKVTVRREGVESETQPEVIFIWASSSSIATKVVETTRRPLSVRGGVIRMTDMPGSGTLTISTINGARALTLPIGEVVRDGAIPLNSLGLAPGYYIIRTHWHGKPGLSHPVIIGR
jgi:hypothetical protein